VPRLAIRLLGVRLVLVLGAVKTALAARWAGTLSRVRSARRRWADFATRRLVGRAILRARQEFKRW